MRQLEEVIHKVTLRITNEQLVTVPRCAEFLTVQMQGDSMCLWYKFPTMYLKNGEDYAFYVVGTGNKTQDLSSQHESIMKGGKEIKPPATYLTTVQMYEGNLVWHVFYRKVKHD